MLIFSARIPIFCVCILLFSLKTSSNHISVPVLTVVMLFVAVLQPCLVFLSSAAAHLIGPTRCLKWCNQIWADLCRALYRVCRSNVALQHSPASSPFQVRRQPWEQQTQHRDIIWGYLNRLKGAEGAQLFSLFSILEVCCDLLYFWVTLQEHGCWFNLLWGFPKNDKCS